MKRIQDVKPAREVLLDALEEESAREQYERQRLIDTLEDSELIEILYERNVPFSRVFGQYYEMEEAGNGRMMTVEDARLAGFSGVHVELSY